MAGLVAAVVQQVLTPEASPSMPSSPTMPVGTGYWFSAITLSLSQRKRARERAREVRVLLANCFTTQQTGAFQGGRLPAIRTVETVQCFYFCCLFVCFFHCVLCALCISTCTHIYMSMQPKICTVCVQAVYICIQYTVLNAHKQTHNMCVYLLVHV